MARPIIDITGNRYGRLIALCVNVYNKKEWLFKCDCGKSKMILKHSVVRTDRRTIKSCGCLGHEYSKSGFNKTHGMTGTHFFRKRDGMIGRCYRSTHYKFRLRGGKGVICEWSSFQSFMNDMYKSYLEHVELYGEKNTTLDRIDSSGNYCKENCRRATYIVQNNNR